MHSNAFGTQWQEQEDVLVEEDLAQSHNLVLWNDEVNTFDWVIESLVSVCKHSEDQAEQCAMLIHFKGKYAVRKGTFEALKPQCEALLERGLSATIDS